MATGAMSISRGAQNTPAALQIAGNHFRRMAKQKTTVSIFLTLSKGNLKAYQSHQVNSGKDVHAAKAVQFRGPTSKNE